MRFRQVHLDFHTCEDIENVGGEFSREQFQACLKMGHVDSITLFSKCHHGWAYHPSKANKMHPGLHFDLLREQISAAHELGIKTPVYLSAGFDERVAREKPEWLLCNKDQTIAWTADFTTPGYHRFCYNTGYLDFLLDQVAEVCQNYDADEIFLDMVHIIPCYCHKCMNDMRAQGLDPFNEENAYRFAYDTYMRYTKRVRETVDKYRPGLPVFHNAGHLPVGNREYAYANTHLELESLPTGGWGYDHFPLSAAYVRTLKDTEFLGMTGKFHRSWGEFGGFKHPNALIYETSLSIANGAGCSIGDQMHPLGEMNMSTYSLIGKAYALVEEKEPWLNGAVNVADIVVLSAEATTGDRDVKADIGANRMLLEEKYLYNFVDSTADFSEYKMLIIPDIAITDDETIRKIQSFVNNGGKVIATGEAIVKDGSFFLDTGAEFIGKNELEPTYLVPCFDTVNGATQYVMLCNSYKIEAKDCETAALGQNPYFNRTLEHFCSHAHTPNNPESSFVGAVIKGNVAYISWDIFSAYAKHGHLCFKELFAYIADRMMGKEKTVSVAMPDKGVVTLTRQEKENRSILHLLFAHTTVRGRDTEVIEDTVPLYNVECSIKCESKPTKVTLVPSGEEIPFTYENGEVNFTVPKVDIHQMAEIQYICP